MGHKFSIKIIVIAAFAAIFLLSGANSIQAKSQVCQKYDNYRAKFKNDTNKKAYQKIRWLRRHDKKTFFWYKTVYNSYKNLAAAELEKLSPAIQDIFRQFRGYKRYHKFLTYREKCHDNDENESSEKQILAFSLTYPNSSGSQRDAYSINQTNHTITFGEDTWDSALGLTPVITVSPGATVSPASGVATDGFADDESMTFTVTAEDGSTQDYLATINLPR